MKKILPVFLALGLLAALSGCGDSGAEAAEQVYSFSGENEEIRVVNGVAVLGGGQETLYGGTLELKTGAAEQIATCDMKFYVQDGPETWTLLNMVTEDRTGGRTVEKESIGQITGPILRSDLDTALFEEALFFELTLTHEDGTAETHVLPMEVTEVTGKK